MSAFENRIAGMEKTTLLDFPGKVACILFYNGCRTCHCPYCYNKALWKGDHALDLPSAEVASFLEKRRGKLDGVVFSGGECTVWGEDLLEDISWCRECGYAAKVDTNGTNPDLVLKMITEGLVDYVALDIKCPRSKWSYFYRSEEDYKAFCKTLDILMCHKVPFETRTTIHPDLVDEDDASVICRLLKTVGYTGTHYFQFFFNNGENEYLDGNLNPEPRPFDLGRVHTHGTTVGLRNETANTIGELK